MRLTGPEYARLEEALGDAFVGYDELRSVLRRAGWRLQDVAPPGPMPTVIVAVIEFAEARDEVHLLIAAARAAKPTNGKLLQVAGAIGLKPAGVAVDAIPADAALGQVTARLERMVDAARGIADLGSFAAKLQELLRQVCAVELGADAGTGFLIGPDTILTNYHVIEKAAKGSSIRPRSVCASTTVGSVTA